MDISIVNIGDELLIGQVVNSNVAVMSKMLVAAGMNVKETAVIGDDRGAILSTVQRLMNCSDVVLVTGGLGPTKDDVTKKVLCELFGSKLEENQMALDNVKRIFEGRGYELTPVNRLQAWVPECCEVLNNDLGT
ncbi:MAG: competence/damage-inducible protein A, partial [Bacteroidales bacterium]|nr:competence/damage-inducible protein A [Bacteroidales bacterium]